MADMYRLHTKFIPWKYREEFNRIAGAQVRRYESSRVRPGLLNRDVSFLPDDVSDNGYIVVIDAYANDSGTGFYLDLSYPTTIRHHQFIKALSRRIRDAVRQTTGSRIRARPMKLPMDFRQDRLETTNVQEVK